MKTEWKVLVSLVAILLVMEGGVRAFETRLSKDLAHLRELPAAAQRLKESKAYKILIVGNSLARYGIDRKLLARELENKGYGKVLVEAFYPDATGIAEWSFGLRRYFLNLGAIPDRIILVTGKTHLLDTPVVPERLGAFYVDRSDVKEAILLDLGSVESTTRFFLAQVSGLFANRARIRPFVFYNYLPAYTQTIQEINDWRKMMAAASERKTKQQTTNLSRLLQVAQSNGIAVSVVVIPMFETYDLPQVVIHEIGVQGAPIWDLSKIEGIGGDNFFDGYHLDAEGARRLTSEMIHRF